MSAILLHQVQHQLAQDEPCTLSSSNTHDGLTKLGSPSTPTFSPSWSAVPRSPREQAQTRLFSTLSASAARRRSKPSNQEVPATGSQDEGGNGPTPRASEPAMQGPNTRADDGQDATSSADDALVPALRIEVEQDDDGLPDVQANATGHGLGIVIKSFAARRAARGGNLRIHPLTHILHHVDNKTSTLSVQAASPAKDNPSSPTSLRGHSRSASGPASLTLVHTPFRVNHRGFEPDSTPCERTEFELDDVRAPRPGSHQGAVGTVVHSTTDPPTTRAPPRRKSARRPSSVSHHFGPIEVKLTPPTPMLFPLTPPPHHRQGPPPSPALLTTPRFQLAPGHHLQQEQVQALWQVWIAHAQAAAMGQPILNMISPQLSSPPVANFHRVKQLGCADVPKTASAVHSARKNKELETNVGAKSWRISSSKPADSVSTETVSMPRSAGPTYHRDSDKTEGVLQKHFDIPRATSPTHAPSRNASTRLKSNSRPGSPGPQGMTVFSGAGNGFGMSATGSGSPSWRSTTTSTFSPSLERP